MSHIAPTISLTNKQRTILTKISSSRSLPKSLITRAQIILYASKGMQNKDIGPKVSLSRVMVGVWRKRWSAAQPILLAMENEGEEDAKYKEKIREILSERVSSNLIFTFNFCIIMPIWATKIGG